MRFLVADDDNNTMKIGAKQQTMLFKEAHVLCKPLSARQPNIKTKPHYISYVML